MSDTYRVQSPAWAFDGALLAGEPSEAQSLMTGALDPDGSPLAPVADPGAEEGAWNPFVLGEPARNYVHDTAAWMRPVPRISSLFDERSEFQPHLPSLADLLDLRMQRDEFAKILSETLDLRFNGNLGAMAVEAGVGADRLALYVDGGTVPKGAGELYSIARGLSLDSERLSYAWIYSSMRGFEDARRHQSSIAPEFLKMRVMAQSAAFLLGERIPTFENPTGRGAPDVSLSKLIDNLMTSLRAGFDEGAVYEIFSDCAWHYPAAVTQMLEDPVKALEWFGGGAERDAAVIKMVSTLQLSSGSVEDAVTLDVNAGALLDRHKRGEHPFDRRIDEIKLEFYERALEAAKYIKGGVERLKDVGFDSAVEALRGDLYEEGEAYWVNDILSDPLSRAEDGNYRPEAIERVLQRVFNEAVTAGDPLFIGEEQIQNISEMGRMFLMLGPEIPLESRLSFYHMQHLIAVLRRGGAAAQEILSRYAPSMKGIVELRRADLEEDAAPLSAREMAEQITDRLGGEFSPASRMDLRSAVAFAYLGILAGIEPGTAVDTAAAQLPAGARLYMQALEGASATIKKGHPYRAALTVQVAARRLAMDEDWCAAMQLYCAGGETMTKAHQMLGSSNVAVHDLMMWMRRDFFKGAQEASRMHIPRSMRAVRDEFKGKISAGMKQLASRPYLAGVSGADLSTGERAWSAFGDAARSHRRVVETEFRPIRSVPYWEPSVYSPGGWIPSAGALFMAGPALTMR